jgi:alpha-tubulin suppressor-like RCC1 family protein
MRDVPVGGNVTYLSGSYGQQCALLEGGTVRCWGLNHIGQLGYPHQNDVGAGGVGGSIVSNGDLPFGGRAVQVAPSSDGVCVLLDTGNVRCWGGSTTNFYDDSAALTAAQAALQGDVEGLRWIKAINAGVSHFCAVAVGGQLRCWGWGASGALGYGDNEDVGFWDSPGLDDKGDVPVGGPVAQVDAGEQTTCAVLENGALRCWGENNAGQLGYNNTTTVGDGVGPTIIEAGDVPLGGPALRVEVDDWDSSNTCALLESGAVRCWGLSIGNGYDNPDNISDGGSGGTIIENGDVPIL